MSCIKYIYFNQLGLQDASEQFKILHPLKMPVLELRAGVIVSHIKHHSSTAAGTADCSPLLSYHTDLGH